MLGVNSSELSQAWCHGGSGRQPDIGSRRAQVTRLIVVAGCIATKSSSELLTSQLLEVSKKWHRANGWKQYRDAWHALCPAEGHSASAGRTASCLRKDSLSSHALSASARQRCGQVCAAGLDRVWYAGAEGIVVAAICCFEAMGRSARRESRCCPEEHGSSEADARRRDAA